MKHLIPALLCTVALLCACQRNNTVFDETHTFNGNNWNRFTPEQFEIDVPNAEDYYNIDFTVSVDTSVYRYKEFPLMVIMTSPAGEERQFYHTIILNEKGRWRGEVHDGLRTVQGRVRSYFTFNRKGTHTMLVSQTTSQYDLEGIHSLQVTVDKTKLEYNLD